jgi:hypothetical protein
MTPQDPTLSAIKARGRAGATVASILGASVTDPDVGARKGIAVTALSGAGVWQYSLNNGASWIDFGAVSTTAARLLRATDKVRFIPTANSNGIASLTFVAWDQTFGTAGALADASTRGGATPFSLA